MRFTLVIPLAPERNAEIINAIRKLKYDKNEFHVIVAVGRNPSKNRNKSIEKAKGDYIVFLDDDAFINEDYLNKVDEFLEKHLEIDVVGGPQLTPQDDNIFAKISGYGLSSRFGAWKLANRYDSKKENLDVDETALTSANLVCKKEVVEKVKFDENLFPGEDPKFISDVKKQGFRVAYTPKFILYHKRRPNYKLFVKQMFNYGKVRPKKESFLETLKKPFFLIPSLFFVYLILLIGNVLINSRITSNVININAENFKLSLSNLNLGFLWFLPLIAYILLVILFTFYDSLNNEDFRAIFVLPFIYPTIHLSYGVGMIYGYLKKLV